MKQSYKVIWTSPSGATLASVSFSAASHAGIAKQVKQIAKQIGFKTHTCEVWRDGQLVQVGFSN